MSRPEGTPTLSQALHEQDAAKLRWIIVPVTIPGTGRAQVVDALEQLFDFARVSLPASANVPTRHRARHEVRATGNFSTHVSVQLEQHSVVVIDSNNYLIRHRRAVRSIIDSSSNTKLLALNWDFSHLSLSALHAICTRRLGGTDTLSGTDIWHYVRSCEALQPGEVDISIDVSLRDDIWSTIVGIVETLTSILHLEYPSPQRMQSAARFLSSQPAVAPRLHIELATGINRQPASPPRPHTKAIAHTQSIVERLVVMLQALGPAITSRSFVTAEGVVTCWKARKTAFYTVPCALPILARSFWTCQTDSTRGTVGVDLCQNIVARGYDKFFAINDMPWVTWDAIIRYTQPPYHVTPKLDGCLIMVSALSRAQLLVTSKHSWSAQPGRSDTHAQAGDRWLSKHLDRAERSRSELASHLWDRNWTLMCELLDDAYEEHVLPVPPEKAGLYLHGINSRTVSFMTEHPTIVSTFANEWGLGLTPFVTYDAVSKVKDLVAECYKGQWRGGYIPGFVIRTRIKQTDDDIPWGDKRPPYPPPGEAGSTFFFEARLKQPYALWHDLRRITRVMAGTKGGNLDPSFRLAQLAPLEGDHIAFELWLKAQFNSTPGLRDSVAQGHGLIALRTKYLSWSTTTTEGNKARSAAEALVPKTTSSHKKPTYGSSQEWLILLVGLPGCGKTVLCEALARLYNFCIIRPRTRGFRSARAATKQIGRSIRPSFRKNDVVIVDAHCHRAARREHLRVASLRRKDDDDDDDDDDDGPHRLVLEWKMPFPDTLTAERISSLRLAAQSSDSLADCERTVRRFLSEYEPLGEHEVPREHVVSINYSDSALESLDRVVTAISRLMGIRRPSGALVREAARGMAEGGPNDPLAQPLTRNPDQVDVDLNCHFAFFFALDAWSVLAEAVTDGPLAPQVDMFWKDFPKGDRRLPRSPRVTIVHPRMDHLAPIDMNRVALSCAALPPSALFRLSFTDIICNKRIAIAQVRTIAASSDSDLELAGFVDELPLALLTQLHVVVARQSPLVSPQEALDMIQSLQDGRSAKGIARIPLKHGVHVHARVCGVSRP